MFKAMEARWAIVRAWHRETSRIGRISFWLCLLAALLMTVRVTSSRGGWAAMLLPLCLLALVPTLLFLLLRFARQRLLWSVRNRLILTYVLMGLAPVILFGTLAAIAAYIFAGQYAINTALNAQGELLEQIRTEASGVANTLSAKSPSHLGDALSLEEIGSTHEAEMAVAQLVKGTWTTVSVSSSRGILQTSPFAGEAYPAWMPRGFEGALAINGHLFLCRELESDTDKRSTKVLATMPLDEATLGLMANHLGRVMIFPGFSRTEDDPPRTGVDVKLNKDFNQDLDTEIDDDVDRAVDNAGARAANAASSTSRGAGIQVFGGTLSASSNWFDPPVYFTAPLPARFWQTGKTQPLMLVVASRPSVLYTRLFETSAGIGKVLRTSLIAIALAFGLLEAIALWLAVRLSRTITRSVAGLYLGTTEIDKGNLAYRVKAERRDQFGALATSFNRMAGSIQDLLVQQREKDRLLSELAIAQEVQGSLFPHSPVSLSGLDLHAVCLPARSVSGDYFDFILEVQGPGDLVCIALGDISGKGISAALLMASLHSAVRVFSAEGNAGNGRTHSPALLLEKLNRHLYRSTQSNKYATLFLAVYNRETRELTYANGGHLPPLLLAADGTLRKLTCGGSVVGLLDGFTYDEETVVLGPGDLLVAYSDGMTEPENTAGEFGEERLLALLLRKRDEALPALADEMFGAVKAWIGSGEQPDDMTLLFARAL